MLFSVAKGGTIRIPTTVQVCTYRSIIVLVIAFEQRNSESRAGTKSAMGPVYLAWQ